MDNNTKRDAGIFAYGDRANGQIWVGRAPDLAAMQNRLAFMASHAMLRPIALQQAWTSTAGRGFTYEVLERMDPDLSDMTRNDLLKIRLAHWREHLNAGLF